MVTVRSVVDRLVRQVTGTTQLQYGATGARHDRAKPGACGVPGIPARYPAYATTARLDTLRATEYARLDQQGQVYLDYTGGGLYAESQLRDHMALLNGPGVWQPAFQEPDLDGHDRAGRARARARLALLQRLARRIHGDLHPERHRRAQAGRRGVSVRVRRQLSADLRQPQLGQRHPRVRPRQRRRM